MTENRPPKTAQARRTARIPAKRRAEPARAPTPWPELGWVTRKQLRDALGGPSDATLRRLVVAGALPPPERFLPGRDGWRVEVAREVLATLPQRLAEVGAGEASVAHARAMGQRLAQARRDETAKRRAEAEAA